MAVRRAAVAGSWYSGDPARLANEVDRYLADAESDAPPAPRAIIAPHAGLMYSGPVAAFAYQATRGATYRTVVLVGPSHFVPFEGVSIWPEGAWDTPFGPLAVDRELGSAIRASGDGIIDLSAAHAREHSLEMQLPFVARLMPSAAIVPLVIGHQTRRTAFALGDALALAISSRARTSTDDTPGSSRVPSADVLLVASSDLSHYESASVAAAMDDVVARHVDAFDPEGLMETLEREPRHACGGGAIVAVLHAARRLGATTSRVLQYADSGDVSGDTSSVVGYMAAGIW